MEASNEAGDEEKGDDEEDEQDAGDDQEEVEDRHGEDNDELAEEVCHPHGGSIRLTES